MTRNEWNFTPYGSEIIQLKNVDVWTAREIKENQDVEIRYGRLIAVRPSAKNKTSGRWVMMPSAVDTQVHLRTPGQPEKETPETGVRAALYGGVGAVLAMPNTKPILDSVAALNLAQELLRPATEKYGIKVLLSVAGTLGQKGESVAPIETLAQAGAVAVTDDGKGILDDSVQQATFEAAARAGIPFLQHAETAGAEGPLAPGPVTRKLGLKGYDEKHEVDMVERDLKLLRKSPNTRYHVLHVSSGRVVDLVAAAKADGLKVTAEVSPHHLMFTVDDIDVENKSFKMNPPLRTVEDRDRLRTALAEGVIDWVATDHAPHDPESKAKPFSEATFGTLGLETFVPTVLHLVALGILSKTRAVEVLASTPANFLKIDSEFGHLNFGRPVRATLVDPNKDWIVRGQMHQSLSKNTCFDGVRIRGAVLGQFTASGFFNNGLV